MSLASRRYPTLALIAATVAPAAMASPPSGYRLQWADEFTYGDERIGYESRVDLTKWDVHYSWGSTHNHNAGSVTSNIITADDKLTLLATDTPTSGKDYSTGVVNTADTLRLDSGYIEGSMKMPNRWGSWPAFWMLNTGWPPEIDIMEYPLGSAANTNDNRYYTNYFYNTQPNPPSNGSYYDTGIDLGQSFNTFAINWVDDVFLEFYFNGTMVKRTTNPDVLDDFDNMYMILNYAVGGWPGDPSSTVPWPEQGEAFEIDWVRVWQQAPSSNTSTYTNGDGSWHSWDNDSNWSDGAPNLERVDAVFDSVTPSSGGRPAAAMEIRWDGSRTVGNLNLDGQTAYTLGEAYTQGDANSTTVHPRSLMFANTNSGWGRLQVLGGLGGHVINSRIDAWSNVVLRNQGLGALTVNGDIIGQTRDNGNGTMSGGLIKVTDGHVVLNGDGYYRRDTWVTDGSTFELNGRLYLGNLLPYGDTKLDVDGGSTIILDTLYGLDDFRGTLANRSLGQLGMDAANILLDNGTIVLRQTTGTERGFTIGAGGATILSEGGNTIFFASANPNRGIDTTAGGDLTLGGAALGDLQKSLGGAGDLIKTGGGEWTLSALNTYAGTTQILGGKLTVDGSTGAGNTSVAFGATLGGSGDIQGSLNVTGGTVSPGNSAGTLSVGGDFAANSAATLLAELTAGGADLLDIAGLANLGGNLDLQLQPGYTPDFLAPVTLLEADLGVLGVFGSLSGVVLNSTPELDALAVTYGANAVNVQRALQGDYNLDGNVDLLDFDVLAQNFGAAGAATWSTGDANGDGAVDLLDFDLLAQNFGGSTPGVVPEPAAGLLLAAGMLTLTRRRRA